MNWLKQNWFKVGVIILLVVFIGFQFYREFKPKPTLTKKEQAMECLKLGSDMRADVCLKLLGYRNSATGMDSLFYGLFDN